MPKPHELTQVIKLEIPEIENQKERIDKHREKLKKELKMYMKNVAPNRLEEISNVT